MFRAATRGRRGAATTSAVAQVTVYTDDASFQDAIMPDHYFEAFDSVGLGPSGAIDFGPVNGFSFNVDSETPGTLFNGDGVISTNTSSESIIVTFTGDDVTAVGGNFWSTDVNLEPFASLVNVMLDDGTLESFVSTSADDFRGFTSDQAIMSLTITAQSEFDAVWSTLDNLYVGTMIPAPGGVALLLVSAAATVRRRR